MSDNVTRWFGVGAAGSGPPTPHDIAARMTEFSRARREVFMPYGIAVNDICWELLLVLFVAQERGHRLSIYRLCDDMPVPKVVSVRWLRALKAHNLVDFADEEGLSATVRLTDESDVALRRLIEV